MTESGSDDDFEQRIAIVVGRAARIAKRLQQNDAPPTLFEVAPEQPAGTPAHELAFTLGLAPDKLELVWSVVAHAVEPRVAAATRSLFGGEGRTGVSLANHIAWSELSAPRSRALLAVVDPRHPLRTSGILVPMADPPFDVSTPWVTSPRVIDFLRGEDRLDPVIESLGGIVQPGLVRHSRDQEIVLGKLRNWLGSSVPTTIVLEGSNGSGRRTAVALAAGRRRVVSADFQRVSPRQAESVLLALRRETVLLDAIPILANLDELWSRFASGDEIALGLASAIDRITGPVVVTTSTPRLELGGSTRMLLRARWPLPDATTRYVLWSDALGDSSGPEAELDVIAHRYEQGAGGIAAAVRSGSMHAAQRGVSQPALVDLSAGIQDNIAERLGELAQRVEPKQEWSELVLAQDIYDDVRGLIGRVRHSHFVLDSWNFRKKLARGAGVAALFSGPPGTGKTMVAGLIARELQLELYQVDLSRIVSKWVGETEKQLAKVFEAAEAGHALLLFDEADALFAKRSAEVKSAVDRYANLEVNYLLQRVESFGGVVILTTNLDSSIDPALRRRLAAHILFANPELEERVQLWRDMLATGAPLETNLDLKTLAAEFREMSGANIRNAVLKAAFLAVEEGRAAISRDHLRRAARSEYRAMGHVLTRETSTSRL